MVAKLQNRDRVSALLKSIWKASPSTFARTLSRGRWKTAPHLETISDRLVDASYQGNKRIVITTPPRHGKSELISHWFPVWFLERFPDRHVIQASYAAELAKDWGRRNRNTIRENEDRLRVRVCGDSHAADRWDTTAGGRLFTTGVGGIMTGRGGHLVIIDDPIKNLAEAFSATHRRKVWEWYTSTVRTRLEPGGTIVIIQTRWHEDDLAGRLLKTSDSEEQIPWEHLDFPAIATRDTDDRKTGDPLWPYRYDLQALNQIRSEVGDRVWSSLYQQNPLPDDAALFPESGWKLYGSPPDKFDHVVQSWDLAFKDLKTSDFVVGQVWGFLSGAAYLLDQVRGRLDFTATVRAMLEMKERFPSSTAVYVEDAANGPSVVSHLRSKLRGLILVRATHGKESRAAAVQPFHSAGNLWIPDPAIKPWAKDFILECLSFPVGAHDDQVDAMTQAISQVWIHGSLGPTGVKIDLTDLVRESPWKDA